MGVYKLSSKAEFDLEIMYEFGISKFGLIQAQKYFFEMQETFKLLGRNVNLGRDASEFIDNLKRFSFKSHTIFYFKSLDEIFIIRVLSQQMDYEQNLQLE
ncbi:type II toxin-antitoxin system RelE/ParE family toxin [Aequorivita marisscotiae]|uniref:Toxin n=1 Tax=Aequorivita marisscotiae TaxID=3040348 RepID=A0ABY8KRB8_9FLAO|nr:type II toxin-antitoxin system RelE/ParE family toxin [Aequorivita sp. Ant34-E75]WGF92011.1 type II toxin-antitoxin system RelE/ParE family toxin [Aequorivita sp. Ant34-E75]